MANKKKLMPSPGGLPKSPSGIMGLDEITGGGLPQGRPTLVCGGPGCGKTVMAMEFIVRGALQYNEPGVFMSFEEPEEELIKNFAAFGFDLRDLIKRKKIAFDHVFFERHNILETGEFDLEGLFIRLASVIQEVRAKRVALDTIESLFSGFRNHAVLRAELRRLFHWLKDQGVTAIITGESGERTLTRHGLEEYVADCVIVLDHRMKDQIGVRRLRVVKYRGSNHGVDEYPFMVGQNGMSVLPITSIGLIHGASSERVSTGIEPLDTMLEGKGYYRGSTVLITGSGGTGKSSIAAHFADAACRRGEKALIMAFEESEGQIVRNMKSIGIDLGRWINKGLLRVHATRPTFYGLEAHLLGMHQLVSDFEPAVVVMDPVSNLISVGNLQEVKSMLMRLVDFLKLNRITTVCTHLTPGGGSVDGDGTEIGVSSLMDTWIVVSFVEGGGERNRRLYVLKSRGMQHSHQMREMVLTSKGVQLADIYSGAEGLMGAARAAQESINAAEEEKRKRTIQRLSDSIKTKQSLLEAQLAAMRAQFEIEKQDIEEVIQEEGFRGSDSAKARSDMGRAREADKSTSRRSR